MNNCRKALCVVTVLLFLSDCSKPAVTSEAGSNEFPLGKRRKVMLSLLWWLIVGLVAGALARLIVPGRDPMGLPDDQIVR